MDELTMTTILTILTMGIFGLFGKKPEPGNLHGNHNVAVEDSSVTFARQWDTFAGLGYKLNAGITQEDVWESADQSLDLGGSREKYFEEKPFERLYYHLGWQKMDNGGQYFTNDCIWYDIEFIDESSGYMEFMKRMGDITHGEISYSDIRMRVDANGYEWIDFRVNGVAKSWKLAKTGYIDDSFFQRFSYLPKELGTQGKYTIYDDGGQQFVIDYATESEQKEFIQKTGLQREWLGEGNHFSEPGPDK